MEPAFPAGPAATPAWFAVAVEPASAARSARWACVRHGPRGPRVAALGPAPSLRSRGHSLLRRVLLFTWELFSHPKNIRNIWRHFRLLRVRARPVVGRGQGWGRAPHGARVAPQRSVVSVVTWRDPCLTCAPEKTLKLLVRGARGSDRAAGVAWHGVAWVLEIRFL